MPMDVMTTKYSDLKGHNLIHRSADKNYFVDGLSPKPFISTPSKTSGSSGMISFGAFTSSMVTCLQRFLVAESPSTNLRGSLIGVGLQKRSTQADPKMVSSNPDPSPPDINTRTAASHQNLGTLSKIYHYEKWSDYTFIFMFMLASFMGSILNYSIFLCTTLNSALTTAVVGALKNVAVTYIGMVLFGDYNFSWVNFVGINISIAGSLYYTYITIFKGVKGFGGV